MKLLPSLKTSSYAAIQVAQTAFRELYSRIKKAHMAKKLRNLRALAFRNRKSGNARIRMALLHGKAAADANLALRLPGTETEKNLV